MGVKIIDTFLPIEPQPWRRARKNGKRHFTDAKSRAYRDAVASLVKVELPQGFPNGMAFRMDACFLFRIPKSWPKYKKLSPPVHLSRPDVDNLGKALADALNGIIWDDDSQIYDWRASKGYAETPGIHLKIMVESEI